MNRAQAQQLLQTALANPAAEFRDGQWEAIDALVNHRQKLLVVQRTAPVGEKVRFILSAPKFSAIWAWGRPLLFRLCWR